MAKAILEYDLNDYGDRAEHKRAVNSTNAYITLHKIENMIRNYTRYDIGISVGSIFNLPEGPHTLNENESVLLNLFAETIQNNISNIIEDSNINMDDLE